MTPRRKGARFLIHPMFARQLAYQLSRNKVAKLMQYTQLVRGWFCPFGVSSFLSFHRWFLNRNHRLTTRPTFFFCYLWDVIDCKGRLRVTSRRDFIKLTGLTVSSMAFPAIHAQSSLNKGRPNILWIHVDDISPHTSCYGETAIETPNIDRMAREGVLFRNAFSTSPYVLRPVRR